MTVYNKLKIAILAIFSSQHLYAITLDPLQIQSAPGELLYAEMSFHQADTSSKLDVSLATPEDLMMIGAAHQPPANLNFFTRRNNQGEGVIVITSSRPINDAELNIILKIQESGSSHLKHIKQPIRQNNKNTIAKTSNEKSLAPKFIVSEKDIALNLPVSAHFSTTSAKEPDLKQERLLNAPFTLPPTLNVSESKNSVATTVSIITPNKVEPSIIESIPPKTIDTITTKTESKQNVIPVTQENNQSINPTANAKVTPTVEKDLKSTETKINEQKEKTQYQAKKMASDIKKKILPPKSTMVPEVQTSQQHVVQRNESLWSIAQQIAAQTQQPVAKVMTQIKAQNEHAFIGGNANRLRQGSHLNFNLNTTPPRQNQTTNQTAAQITRPTSGKAKYRLQQAEMSLVAESNQDSSTGSAKKDTLQQKTSADLSLKVMTAREKTVTLQRNVTQLELALRNKEQRIQLLNARLAELQDQLKAQQETKKPTR
ncbi:MAG: FimV domain-containing protein [Moraxellaceae bacterium]|nr:FimV domain-containing protein [Moraxellaceae bacterium]